MLQILWQFQKFYKFSVSLVERIVESCQTYKNNLFYVQRVKAPLFCVVDFLIIVIICLVIHFVFAATVFYLIKLLTWLMKPAPESGFAMPRYYNIYLLLYHHFSLSRLYLEWNWFLQLPEEAKDLEKELRQITKEKNEAVRSQEFEKVMYCVCDKLWGCI